MTFIIVNNTAKVSGSDLHDYDVDTLAVNLSKCMLDRCEFPVKRRNRFMAPYAAAQAAKPLKVLFHTIPAAEGGTAQRTVIKQFKTFYRGIG